jgi:hypothetical protein
VVDDVLPAWESVVKLHSSSASLDPRSLHPGRDLVLNAARSQGVALQHGVLLDDWLSDAVREELDREALDSLREWRRRRDGELSVDGVSLPFVWEIELLAEVFLPETRVADGVRAAVEQARHPRRIDCHGLDAERVSCLQDLLEPLGIDVRALAVPAAPPRYPTVLAAPNPVPWSRRLGRAVALTPGIPGRAHGAVYVLPYWHLTPIFERLAEIDDLRPVVDPGSLPAVPYHVLARAALSGGWIGKSSLVERRRSRRALLAAIASARTNPSHSRALEDLFDRRALRLLEQRAAETIANIRRLRKAFGGGRIKVAVVPYDSPPEARMIVHVGRETGIPTLVVQHGFAGASDDPDKTVSDACAVWSEMDVRSMSGRAAGRVVRTGNPGLTTTNGTSPPNASGHSLVLVEYELRLSARFDNRLSARHVTVALKGLEAARAGTAVTVRPHPAEHEPEIFEVLAQGFSGIHVKSDTQSSIEQLIGQCDLCVGAVSTATLQAAAAGVPVIFLNVTERVAPWPFDGSTDVPIATSAETLAELIPSVVGSGVPGRAAMLEALGADADALDNTVGLIRSLAIG